MSLDWSQVRRLAAPIRTTGHDVVLSGHGTFEFQGETLVPEGIELWLLAPPGALIADSAGQALENRTPIFMTGIRNPGSNVLVNNQPIVRRAGESVPNYVLRAPRDILVDPRGPHVIGVERATALDQLWRRLAPFTGAGRTVRCFWAACTAIRGAGNPVVLTQ